MWKIIIIALAMASCAHLPITVDYSQNDTQVVTSVTSQGVKVTVVHKGSVYECGYFRQGDVLSVKTTGGKVTVGGVSCSLSLKDSF